VQSGFSEGKSDVGTLEENDNKTPHIMLSLYKPLIVRPHVEYCVSAWSPHYIKDKDALERIQHKCIVAKLLGKPDDRVGRCE